jgi:hypothetical protein
VPVARVRRPEADLTRARRQYLLVVESLARVGRTAADPREAAAAIRILAEPSAYLRDLATQSNARVRRAASNEIAPEQQKSGNPAPVPLNRGRAFREYPSARQAQRGVALERSHTRRFPALGHEPFNLSPDEIDREWGQL